MQFVEDLDLLFVNLYKLNLSQKDVFNVINDLDENIFNIFNKVSFIRFIKK